MHRIEIGSKVSVKPNTAYPGLVGYQGMIVGERNGIAVLDFDGSKLCLPYEILEPVITAPKPAPLKINLKTLLNSVYGISAVATPFKSFLLPDKIIFNEEKGKTTLLFANTKKKIYNSVSSKTDGKDRFDKMFGFYMAYFKYLNANKDTEAFIEYMYKEASSSNRLRYLKGAVDVLVPDLVEFHAMAENAITKDVWVREDYEAQVKKEKNRIRKEAVLKLKIEAKEAELDRLKGKLK